MSRIRSDFTGRVVYSLPRVMPHLFVWDDNTWRRAVNGCLSENNPTLGCWIVFAVRTDRLREHVKCLNDLMFCSQLGLLLF